MNMVFHPKFATNRKFYVNYTKTGPKFALAEFTMKADFTVDVTTFKEVGTFPQFAFVTAPFRSVRRTRPTTSAAAWSSDPTAACT